MGLNLCLFHLHHPPSQVSCLLGSQPSQGCRDLTVVTTLVLSLRERSARCCSRRFNRPPLPPPPPPPHPQFTDMETPPPESPPPPTYPHLNSAHPPLIILPKTISSLKISRERLLLFLKVSLPTPPPHHHPCLSDFRSPVEK